ncbi:MAG: hypothetical protein AABN33_23895 [Acidobacteriota bacterium]
MHYRRLVLFAVALVATAAASSSAQDAASRPPTERPFKHSTEIFEAYVSDADAVLVKSKPIRIVGGSGGEVELTAEFASRGQEVTRPDSILLGFISRSRVAKYNASTHLVLKADGEQISFDTTQLKIFVLNDSVIEMLFTPIPCNIFLRIANAKTVQVSLGDIKLELTEGHLEVLRDVASRTVPHSLPQR